ncbi:cytochrome d ubiquinol oxidase subunit II [Rossellomorea marisflavi]|uniref:cytochrome d ubiquinol oxidase subunit II n=1 Tax=Rossellomorea marisflavi TaxID=189381 RepID=UPI0028535E2D|nr:cytochrome d ubiquinol oxidase subunit II [Rossellomorea marisflavi]MDR4935827.1 cytochrome d ubiquinol oxidase subunit II [Rossellomorea marisflavi]
MTQSLIAIIILWGFVFIYAVMATMDFGAGFWSMLYINNEKTKATNIANRYLSPTWEVTNTFIVALVVAVYSMFPGAAYSLGTVLLVPGSLILLLLAIRSAFLVFSHVADDYYKPLTYITGITGILIPGLIISVLPISHGSYIDFDNGQELDLGKLFTSPHEFAFFGFAVASTLFLSSLLLADYSKTSKEYEAFKVYRRDAMIIGPISVLMAFLIMWTMKSEATWLYDRMLEDRNLLLISLLGFVIAGAALFLPTNKEGMKGMPRVAVIAVICQYVIASYVYGKAHLPYIIYPEVTVQSGFTDPDSFRAVFFTYIAGFVILFPGFVYFWSLFMNDKRYLRQKED